MDPHGVPDHGRRARPLRLLEAFPPTPTDAWDAAVRADLQEAGVEDGLLWHADERVAVQAYYRRDDLHHLDPLIQAAPGAFPFHRGPGSPWAPASIGDLPADGVRADALHDAGATTVQEIGYAIAEGVDRLAAATDAGRTVDEAARAIAFVVAVGSAYFVEIAKLRALRLLWSQAVAAFGPQDASAARMLLVARTARINKSRLDPHTNLLRATTEAMAAAIGGADRLVVEAFAFDAHLADNVHRILDEEAHLGAVSDPAGGSYLVERLTDALAREAWQLFQQVERDGGYAAALASGAIASAVARARAAQQEAVATRRRTLVGVNDYPDSDRPAWEPAAPAPADLDARFAGARLAEPFEAIRARTVRYTRAPRRPPRVLLLVHGDPVHRTARANFARNLFGCAGFEIAESETLDAGADLVVLCSADAEYPALARDICPRTESPVLVAGRGADARDALIAAGIQGFVHAGIDAVETLEAWQDRLGMPR